MAEYKCPVCRSPCREEGGATMVCTSCEFRFSISTTEAGISHHGNAGAMVSNPTQAGVEIELPSGPPVEIDGYKILGRLGKGGMGEVFKAEQIGLGRLVAIKVLSPELSRNPQLIQRFEREANALAKLQHSSIVWIINKGITKDERVFFAMEFCEGESLRYAIAEGRYNLDERVEIVLSMADTLAYTHGKGIVHRDIKPENIMIHEERNRVSVKILDFGLAGAVNREDDNSNLTREGMGLGTPLYMSPEQRINPRDVDARADIYSVGVVFYELMTGNIPVGRYRAPHLVNDEVPEAFSEIIDQMLEPDREYRTTNIDDASDAIRTVIQAGRGPGSSAPAVPEPVLTTSSFTTRDKKARIEGRVQPGHNVHLQVNSVIYDCVAGEDGTFAFEVPLRDGKNTVTSKAIHKGAESSFTSPVEILALPASPQLDPVPGSVVDSGLNLSGNAPPGALVRIDIGGREWQTPADAGGRFSVKIDIDEGANEIRAWSEVDGLRSTQPALAEVVRPLTPPRLHDAPATLRTSSHTIHGSSNPGSLIEINMNGKLFRTEANEKGKFSFEVPLGMGRNKIQARTTKGGVQSSYCKSIVVNRSLPLSPFQFLTLLGIGAGIVYGGVWYFKPRIELQSIEPIRVSVVQGKASANAEIRILVNEEEIRTVANKDGSFSAEIELKFGKNTVVAQSVRGATVRVATEPRTVILPPPEPGGIFGWPAHDPSASSRDYSAIVQGHVAGPVEVFAIVSGRETILRVSDEPTSSDGHDFKGKIKVTPGENTIKILARVDGVLSSAATYILTAPPEIPEIRSRDLSEDGSVAKIQGIQPTPKSLVMFKSPGRNYDPLVPRADRSFSTVLDLDPEENLFSYYSFAESNPDLKSQPSSFIITAPPSPPRGIQEKSTGDKYKALIMGYAQRINQVILVTSGRGWEESVEPTKDGGFEVPVSLLPGYNEFEVASFSHGLKSTPKSIRIGCPPDPPEVTRRKMVSGGTRLQLAGHSYDGSIVRIRAASGVQAAQALDGSFSIQVDLEPGDNEFLLDSSIDDLKSEEVTEVATAPPPVPGDLVAQVDSKRESASILATSGLRGSELFLKAEGAATSQRMASQDGVAFQTIDSVILEKGDNLFFVWSEYKGLSSQEASLIVTGQPLPIDAPAGFIAEVVEGTRIRFLGRVEAGAQLKVEVAGSLVDCPANAEGNGVAELDLGYGVHRVRAFTQTDEGRSGSVFATVTLPPPAPTNLAWTSGETKGLGAVSGEGLTGASIQIVRGDQVIFESTIDESGAFLSALTLDLGRHDLMVRAGIGGAWSEAASQLIEVAPEAPKDLALADDLAGAKILTGTVSPGTEIVIQLGGREIVAQPSGKGSFQIAVGDLGLGRKPYTASARVSGVNSVFVEGVFEISPEPPRLTRQEVDEKTLRLAGEIEPSAQLVLARDHKEEIVETQAGKFDTSVTIAEGGTEVSLLARFEGVSSKSVDLGFLRPKAIQVAAPIILTQVPRSVFSESLQIAGTSAPGTRVRLDLNGDSRLIEVTESGKFDALLMLREGSNSFSAVAVLEEKDVESNASTPIRTQRIVRLDAATLDAIPDKVEESTLVVAGRSPLAGTEIHVLNGGKEVGKETVDSQSRFSMPVELEPGENSIVVYLTYGDASSPREQKTVVFDDTLVAPVLSELPSTTAEAWLSVSGRASKDSTVHLFVAGNDRSSLARTGRFGFNGIGLSKGKNTLILYATKGSRKSSSVTVTIEYRPPVVDPPRFSPPLQANVEGTDLEFAGKTTAGSQVLVTVNGRESKSFSAAKGSFSGKVVLDVGTNSLVFWTQKGKDESDKVRATVRASRALIRSPELTKAPRSVEGSGSGTKVSFKGTTNRQSQVIVSLNEGSLQTFEAQDGSFSMTLSLTLGGNELRLWTQRGPEKSQPTVHKVVVTEKEKVPVSPRGGDSNRGTTVPTPTIGSVKITSNPSGATVFVDGSPRGRTPVEFSIPAGGHSLKLSKSSYKDNEQQFRVEPGQTSNLNLELIYFPFAGVVPEDNSGDAFEEFGF